MSTTGQLVKNVYFNWLGMAVGIMLSFVQAPIVVKGLGNTWFGIWVLVSQVVSYTWLFDLGIREAVVRHVSQYASRRNYKEINEVVSSAIYIYLLISVLTVLVIIVVIALLPYLFTLEPDIINVARLVLFLSGLNIAINWFFNAYIGILMGLQRFDIFQKIGMSMGVVGFILIIMFIKAGYGIIALSLINFAVSMVSNAVIYWNCRRLLPEFKLLRYERKKIRIEPLVNYGKYVLLNNLGAKIIYGTDAVIIGIYMHVSAITYYAIPETLVGMLTRVINSITWVMIPLFSELEAKDESSRIKVLFKKATKISLLVGLPIGLVFVFMGENFVSLWMGKEYAVNAKWVLIILTVGTLFTNWESISGSVLFGTSRHKIIAWLRAAEATLKICLCIYFINKWGIIGMAMGAALSHVLFMGVILPILVCRDLDMSIRSYMCESIIPTIVSSIPFALCCYFISFYMPAANLFVLFFSIAIIMPVFIISAWYIAFTVQERAEYVQAIYKYVPCLKVFDRQNIR